MILLAVAAAAEPVAVLELYTSQGCSSCPSADALLAELVQTRGDTPLYAMSFHVDYWDRLGWKDPYGSPAHTARQQALARALQSTRVYTPQLVVNGSQVMVGSDKAKVKDAVSKALTTPTTSTVKGRAKREGDGLRVEVNALNAPIGGLLHLAVAEGARENAVAAGENRGHQAVHRNVVRALHTATAPSSSTLMDVPKDFDWKNAEVFAWVVDPLTLGVVGATRLDLEP